MRPTAPEVAAVRSCEVCLTAIPLVVAVWKWVRR